MKAKKLLTVLGAIALAPSFSSASGQAAPPGCRAESGPEAEAGWAAYAADDMADARSRFETALALCPDDQYARTGLGYVALRDENLDRAVRLWTTVVAAEPDNVDALTGLGLAAWRRADLEAAERAFTRVTEVAPEHATALEYLERLRDPALAPEPERLPPNPTVPPRAARPPGAPAEPSAATRPPAPDSIREAADRAWADGDTEAARALYERILRESPDDELALHRTALVLAWEERYEEALVRLDRLVAASPTNLDARVDRARVIAWSGDTAGALAALDAVLEEEPAHAPALEARALFEAWAGRYDESLETYSSLLAIAPDNADARRRHAQVLAWASDFSTSVAAYDSILAADPEDLEARLGRARALAFSDRLSEAIAEYDRVLAFAPDEPRALVGKGRTLGWAGRLAEGETVLRDAIRAEGSADSWVALAQNLRWQGRNAAALQTLERAVEVDPTHGEAREQLRSLRATFTTSASPSIALEADSDGNRMRTVALASSWYATPRWRVRADLYEKGLRQNSLERSSLGVTVSTSYVLEPGWTLGGAVGGTRTDVPAARASPTGHLSVTTPARHPYGATVSAQSSVLDATAALAATGVRMNETSLSAHWRPAASWRLDGSIGYASLDGSERNTRTNAALSASRALGGGFSLGVAGRTFTYAEDLQDGYFDPDFYGIAEVTGRWLGRAGAWSVLLELAPGTQQVTRDGSPSATIRSSARIAYDVAPGREISLSGGYSSTGLQSFSTGDGDYRYRALILSAGWRL